MNAMVTILCLVGRVRFGTRHHLRPIFLPVWLFGRRGTALQEFHEFHADLVIAKTQSAYLYSAL